MGTSARSNAVGLSAVAFASYFDVYSHSHIFVLADPWWNPAHLVLYAGFGVVAYGIMVDRPRGMAGRLSLLGIILSAVAALFNEVWHRVLLFGNPLPEPFPVEPPHAVLAVAIVILGVAAMLNLLDDVASASATGGGLAVAFTAGSLWLVIAGSAFYVGGAYNSLPADLFAVGVGSFAASLFIAFPAAVTRRFGYTTLSYAWFLVVFYLFFVPPVNWIALGLPLVALLDYLSTRGKIRRTDSRLVVLIAAAFLYGLIYYPILPPDYTLAINAGTLASVAGVALEFIVEKATTIGFRNSGVGGSPLR